MSIVTSDSGDLASGIVINNYNQQNEPLLFSRRLEELLQKRNRKRLVLYFCIGFVLSAFLAIVAYGLSLGVFELFSFVSSIGSKEQCNKRVIGYHQLYHPYNLTDSQLSKLTHLVIGAADIDNNGTIYFRYLETEKKFMEVNERARSLGVKTLISFYARQQLNEIGAKIELINSIINITHDSHLDGIEISSISLWSQGDIQTALKFCKELRQKLRSLNITDFIISLSAHTKEPNAAIKDLIKYVDFVSVQTNLYYAPHFDSNNGAIGPPTPLYGNHIIQNLNQQMKLYSCRSGSPSKLNIMLLFRGNFWKNVIQPENPFDTLWMTAETENETAEGDTISWRDLKNSEVWDISKASWNPESKTPYIWNPENRTYLAFENERSIDEKMKYAMYKNFGGVTINLLNEDDEEDSLLNIVSSEQWCSSKISDEVNYECD